MAIISDTTKIDKAYKNISGKLFTTSQKEIDSEESGWQLSINTSDIYNDSVPASPPGASTATLTYYGDGTDTARFNLIQDISSPSGLAWYASTDGSSLTQMRATRVGNWISPSYGQGYTIRIFLTTSTNTTTAYLKEIFFSDPTNPLFDAKTGVLTFETSPLSYYSNLAGGPPTNIQISGYVYSGTFLNQIFDGNGNFTGGLSEASGTSVAKFLTTSKTFDVSSPHAVNSTWSATTTPYCISNVILNDSTQLSNGIVICVGSFNSNGIVVYSYGKDDWREASLPAGIGTLYSVWASSDNSVIYAIDTSGKLIKSTDDGRTWSLSQTLGADGYLWGSSSSDIYLVGAAGSVQHSTDGITFTSQTNGNTNDLLDIWGVSASNIYAVGKSGTIVYTTGNGTWASQTSGVATDLYGAFGFSSSEIYACGASGTLLTSTGNGTWTNFNTGIPNTVLCFSIWGINSSSVKRLYVSGWDSATTKYVVYYSSGTNSWALQTSYSSSHTQDFHIFGGISGIFGGITNGQIVSLKNNPVESVHGHMLLDGYMTSTSLFSTDIDTTILNVATQAILNATSTIAAMDVIGAGTSNYTVLTSYANDAGEGFRLWREDAGTYTLDLGSKVSTNNDGATPYAAGGKIRLGQYTLSTPRAEIETVSSLGLKLLAYEGDLTISDAYGTAGVSSGNINLTTTNGGITLTAVGSGSPSSAGKITLAPGLTANVNLSDSAGTTYLRVSSADTNHTHTLDSAGNFTATGTITGTSGNINGGFLSISSGGYIGLYGGGWINMLAAANPSFNSAGYAGLLTSKNIIKSWAYIGISGAGVASVLDGFNILSASVDAQDLTYHFKDNMLTTTYAVSVSGNLPPGFYPVVNPTTSSFQIISQNTSGADINWPIAYIYIIVVGR